MGHGFTSLGDWSPWPPESDWEEVVGINLIRFGELSIAAMSSYHKSLKLLRHINITAERSRFQSELHLGTANK